MRVTLCLLIRRLSLGAVASLLCVACATGVERFGLPISHEQVAKIQPGHSSRAEILSLLGPPTYQTHSPTTGEGDSPLVVGRPGEQILVWEYRERREGFATVLLYTFFTQRTLTDTLMVVLDAEGVVSHVAFGRQTGAGD